MWSTIVGVPYSGGGKGLCENQLQLNRLDSESAEYVSVKLQFSLNRGK